MNNWHNSYIFYPFPFLLMELFCKKLWLCCFRRLVFFLCHVIFVVEELREVELIIKSVMFPFRVGGLGASDFAPSDCNGLQRHLWNEIEYIIAWNCEWFFVKIDLKIAVCGLDKISIHRLRKRKQSAAKSINLYRLSISWVRLTYFMSTINFIQRLG